MNTASITQFKGDESRLKSEVPIAHRLTPEYHQLEVERVFKKSWLIVASALDLPQRGSYLVTDVPPLKASLLVVRGDDLVRRGECGEELIGVPVARLRQKRQQREDTEPFHAPGFLKCFFSTGQAKGSEMSDPLNIRFCYQEKFPPQTDPFVPRPVPSHAIPSAGKVT